MEDLELLSHLICWKVSTSASSVLPDFGAESLSAGGLVRQRKNNDSKNDD